MVCEMISTPGGRDCAVQKVRTSVCWRRAWLKVWTFRRGLFEPLQPITERQLRGEHSEQLFTLNAPHADCYVDFSAFGKGATWGHRYCSITKWGGPLSMSVAIKSLPSSTIHILPYYWAFFCLQRCLAKSECGLKEQFPDFSRCVIKLNMTEEWHITGDWRKSDNSCKGVQMASTFCDYLRFLRQRESY